MKLFGIMCIVCVPHINIAQFWSTNNVIFSLSIKFLYLKYDNDTIQAFCYRLHLLLSTSSYFVWA